MTFMQTPPSFTLLQGQIIPAFGGDTLWASATAAYDALSPQMQAFLLPLHAVNDFLAMVSGEFGGAGWGGTLSAGHC